MDLVKYEEEFVENCKSLNIRMQYDEDGCPICKSYKKTINKFIKVVPFTTNTIAIVIMNKTNKTIKSIIKKLNDKKVPTKIYTGGDGEATLEVDNQFLKQVAKFFKMIKREISPERLKQLKENIEKARKAKNDRQSEPIINNNNGN